MCRVVYRTQATLYLSTTQYMTKYTVDNPTLLLPVSDTVVRGIISLDLANAEMIELFASPIWVEEQETSASKNCQEKQARAMCLGSGCAGESASHVRMDDYPYVRLAVGRSSIIKLSSSRCMSADPFECDLLSR